MSEPLHASHLSYSNPEHPEHLDWLIGRRKRFSKIIREGKRACKMSEEERKLVTDLANIIDRETKRLERINNKGE